MNDFQNFLQQPFPVIIPLPVVPLKVVPLKQNFTNGLESIIEIPNVHRPYVTDMKEFKKKDFNEKYNEVKNKKFWGKYNKIAIKRERNVKKRRESFYGYVKRAPRSQQQGETQYKIKDIEELCKMIVNLNLNSDETFITVIQKNFEDIERKGKSFEFISNFSTKIPIILMFIFKSSKNYSFREKCAYLMKCFFIGDSKNCVVYLKSYYKELLSAVNNLLNPKSQNFENLINTLLTIYLSQKHDISFKNVVLTIPFLVNICKFFRKSNKNFVEKNKFLFNLLGKFFITFLEHLEVIPQILINEISEIITKFILVGPMKNDIETNFTLLSVICKKYPQIYENNLHGTVFSTKIDIIKNNLRNDDVLDFLVNVSEANIVNKSLFLDYIVLFETFSVTLQNRYIVKDLETIRQIIYFICKISAIKSIAVKFAAEYGKFLSILLNRYDTFNLEIKVNILLILINVIEHIEEIYIFKFIDNVSIYIIYDQLKEAENYIKNTIDKIDSNFTSSLIHDVKMSLLSFLFKLFEKPKKEHILFFIQKRFNSEDLQRELLNHTQHNNVKIRRISQKLVKRIINFLFLYSQQFGSYKSMFLSWVKCFGNILNTGNNTGLGNNSTGFGNNSTGFGNNNNGFGNNTGFGNNKNIKDGMDID